MLTKIILKNFKSFKNETVFDLTESKYQILKESNTYDGVLKGALLIGPNASGKSNLMRAITTLLDLLFKDNVTITPVMMCLFDGNSIMKLEYHFEFDENKIVYKIEASNTGTIHFEELALNQKVVLERKGNSATIVVGGKEETFVDKVFANTLFLKRAYFSSYFAGEEWLEDLMDFLKNSVYFNAHEKKVITYNNQSLVLEQMEESVLDDVNAFFAKYNMGFEVMKRTKQEVYSGPNEKGENQQIVFNTEKPILYLQRKAMSLTLPINLESLGNQTLLHFLPCFLRALKHSCMLLVDEFSSGFHNSLEELLIKQFMLSSLSSQLIFTSHSTNLLDTKILRPDQIFAVSMENTEGSKLFRISSEYPRETQNLEKMYLSGKFGAIPHYNE